MALLGLKIDLGSFCSSTAAPRGCGRVDARASGRRAAQERQAGAADRRERSWLLEGSLSLRSPLVTGQSLSPQVVGCEVGRRRETLSSKQGERREQDWESGHL